MSPSQVSTSHISNLPRIPIPVSTPWVSTSHETGTPCSSQGSLGGSSGGQNRTPTPAACPHSRFFLGCAAPTPLCPLLSPHWDELGGSGFAHLQPQLRGRAQCHAPHAPPVPTHPCKGRGWPYMARPPAVVFLLLQIPLIPPESSRRQAVTGEESYSRGASLSVRPPQNTETPAGYVCDIMGWVATATGVMEMVAIVRAAPALGISDGHLGFLHRWGTNTRHPMQQGGTAPGGGTVCCPSPRHLYHHGSAVPCPRAGHRWGGSSTAPAVCVSQHPLWVYGFQGRGLFLQGESAHTVPSGKSCREAVRQSTAMSRAQRLSPWVPRP